MFLCHEAQSGNWFYVFVHVDVDGKSEELFSYESRGREADAAFFKRIEDIIDQESIVWYITRSWPHDGLMIRAKDSETIISVMLRWIKKKLEMVKL